MLEDFTNSSGSIEKLNLRAGTRAMVKVLEAPFYHLAPRYMPDGSDQVVFRITGAHNCEMSLPRKPRVKVFGPEADGATPSQPESIRRAA